MKKTKLTAITLTIVTLLCAIGLMACNKGQNKYEIFGFDIPESITVDAGSNVLVDIPIVTDKDGNPLDVIYEVVTRNGGTVGVTANRFFAVDEDGYVINFAVMTPDNVVHTKSMVVIVSGSSSLYVEHEVMVDQGSENQINPTSSFTNPEFNYEVTYKATGESIIVTDGKFVTDKLGFYEIKVTATQEDKTAEYTYEVYCREAMQEGEIERFTSEWEDVRMLSGLDTFDWKVTSSDETGVKDRFGRDAEYIKLVTSAEYGYFWINPRGDEDYYRQLAEEGYTHVSFWIYLDSKVNHDVISQLYPDKGAYTSNIGKVTPGIWTEIKVRLVEGVNDAAGSFASAVDYFKNQQTHILCFDNAAGWNSGGHEENMTLYIADVYAVKPADLKTVENARTEYRTGETVNIRDIVSIPDDVDVAYTMTFRGETTEFDEDTYKFTANGDYTLNVVPSPNISTSLAIVLKVTDNVVSTINNMQIERTSSSIDVNFSSINPVLSVDDAPVTITGHKVYRYGNPVDVEDTYFTAKIDGAYIVELQGEYAVGSETYTTYYDITVDIWSNESKNIVSNGDLMLAHSEYCGWLNWDKHPSYVSGQYTVDGESGRMLKVTKLGQTFLVMMLPMYSKGYYELMLAENPTATVTLKYYVANEKTGNSIRSYFDNFESKSFVRNQWVIDTISLEKFVNDYDNIATGYNEVKYLMDYNITKTHSRNEQDFLFWFSGDTKDDVIYIPDIVITNEAENGEATVKDGAVLKTGEVNNVAEMVDVTLDGELSTIVTAEVNYGGKWIVLPGKTFTPEFGGAYKFRLYATSGNVYKTVECEMVATGEELVAIEDDALYIVKDDETFDLTPYIKNGYDVEYTVQKIIGSTLETVDLTIEGNEIKPENLVNKGNYKITVTLVANSESAFGRFVYYTLYLNYVSEEPEYVTVSEDGATYFKSWNNWGSADSPYGTATLADGTESALDGKDGSFFKVEIKPRWASDADVIGVQVLPLYSKSYYESLMADGESYYKLTFEWNYVSTFEYEKELTSFRYRAYGDTADNFDGVPGTWKQESIDLQTLLDNWDKLTLNDKLSDTNRYLREMLWIRVNGGAVHSDTVGTLYIGNFTLVEAKQTVVEEDVVLLDVNGLTQLDLTKLYDGEIVNATAKLIDSYGNETQVADATTFSLSGVRQGVYTLTINENGNPVYTANVDIYDSADGLVYNLIDGYILYDSQIWKHGYTNIGEATLVDNTLQFQNKLGADGNTNNIGIRMKPLHSKEYYELMSESFEAFTFDVKITGTESDVYVMGAKTYFSSNAKKTMSITLDYLLSMWTEFNNLTTTLPNDTSMLFNVTSFVQKEDTHTYTLSNFGYKVKQVEIETKDGVNLVETSATPTLNLLDYDTENKIDATKSYTATFTAKNGRVVNVPDAKNVVTADIPQGVYAAEVKLQGVTYLAVTVDIYTATDGMIWQEISEYTANDIAQYQYGYNNTGTPTITTVNNAYAISYTLATKADEGLRIRAIHSKEYYEKMSESYDYITFDVVLPAGCNIDVFSDADGNGVDDDGDGIWYSAGTKTLQLPVSFLLDNWDTLNDLTSEISGMPTSDNGSGTGNATHSMLFNVWYLKGYTVSVIGFGSVAKTAE